jgi:hypothetical protein
MPLFKLDDPFCWHPSIHDFSIDGLLLLLAGHVAKEPQQVLLVLPNMMLSHCN